MLQSNTSWKLCKVFAKFCWAFSMATTVGKQKKVFFPSPLIRAGDSTGMQRHKGKVWPLQGHKKTQPSYRFGQKQNICLESFWGSWVGRILYILKGCRPCRRPLTEETARCVEANLCRIEMNNGTTCGIRFGRSQHATSRLFFFPSVEHAPICVFRRISWGFDVGFVSCSHLGCVVFHVVCFCLALWLWMCRSWWCVGM